MGQGGKEDYNEKNNEKNGGGKQCARLTSSYQKKAGSPAALPANARGLREEAHPHRGSESIGARGGSGTAGCAPRGGPAQPLDAPSGDPSGLLERR